MSFNRASWGESRSGGDELTRLVRRLVLVVFAVIQLVLVGRILLDLGIIPPEGLASGLGGFSGLNPVMLGALIGWTVVEGLVMRVVGKFAAV